MKEENKRALLSILCHGSIFFSCFIVSVAIPFAILYTSKDRVVRANAKEALNFHLTIYIWNIISEILVMILIGIILLPVISFFSMIMPIFGIVAVMNEPSVPYRYPGIFRFIK